MGITKTSVIDTTPVTATRLIDDARALRPLLRDRQDEAEQLGTYPEAIHRRFADAGFYSILVPRMFGGLECDLSTYYRVMIEVSRGDPGTGWCLTLGSSHALMAASHFVEAAQRMFFADGSFCAPHTNAGQASLVPRDGGYTVSGRWAYASGIPYASWFFGAARVADGNPGTPKTVAVPRADFTVLDDWGAGRTLGMEASGSNGVVVEGVEVEEHFVSAPVWHERFDPTAPTAGVELHGNPMYLGRGHATYHTSIAAVQVGAALAALDEYEEQLRTRKSPIPPGDPRIQSAHLRSHYGHARVLANSAQALLLTTTDRYGEYAHQWMTDGEPFDLAKSIELFGMAQQAGALAAEAVELMFQTAGTSAAMSGTRLNRYFRDTAMYRGHQSSHRETYWERFANVQLGLTESLLTAPALAI